MRNEFNKVLMGATEDMTLVFADIRVGGEEDYRNYFSVSFSEVRPFIASEDYLRERFSGQLEDFDKEQKYDLCERFDCTPNHLEDVMFNQIMTYGDGVYEIVDISLYPESYNIEGVEDTIYFESNGCGQHDTRNSLIPIDPEFSEWLHNMWEKYHLQTLSDDYKEMTTKKVMNYLDSLNEEEWIQSWLESIKDSL